MTTKSLQVQRMPVSTFSPVEKFYYEKVYLDIAIKEYEIKHIKGEGAAEGYNGIVLARLRIAENLLFVYQMIGLKKENYPDKRLATAINKYIAKTFPYLTPYEVIVAFEMAVQELFDVDLNHYQIIDLKYIHKVFKAYSLYRGYLRRSIEAKTKREDIEDKRKQFLKNRVRTDEAVKRMLTDAYSKHKAGEVVDSNILQPEYYDFLDDLGLIKLSGSSKDNIYKNAHKALTMQKNKDLSYEAVRKRSKKIAILFAFNNLDYSAEEFVCELSRGCFLDPDTHVNLYILNNRK